MFNKIIYTLIASTSLAFLPNDAEAVKLKIEPSVTFRHSTDSTRAYPSRAPVRHVPVRSRSIYRHYEPVPVRPIYRSYEPAPVRTYYEAVPRREVIYYPEYEDVYFYETPTHYHTHTSGTDFRLKFKLK